MTEHIVVPLTDFTNITLLRGHRDWLESWLHEVEENVEKGIVASSVCFQGIISELALNGGIQTDWVGIMDDLLIDENSHPLAYSERYGAQLYNFRDQWKQVPTHAIYTRWWIDAINGASPSDKYIDIIESLIQTNGWIYNPRVSPTIIRTRMKSELMMSMAMGIQMLSSYNLLENHADSLVATLSGQSQTGYVGAEYFRLRCLEMMDALEMAPKGIETCLMDCEAGKGFCDFAVENKMDEYMGTKKRVDRDEAVHSPLISLYAERMSRYCTDTVQSTVATRLSDFGAHLYNNTLDIPAFKMRDLDVPFGTDITPIELICASYIASHFNSNVES